MEEVSSSVNDDFSSILPPDWGTKIIEKKIIEGEDKFPNILLHFVVNCTNQEELGKWLTEFESLTNASYVISNTDIEDGERIKLKRRLRCHHFTRCLKTYEPSKKNKTRNTNCPSKLTVKIHVIRKKYRGTQEKFKLLYEAPCEITLVVTHNHTTGTADSLRFRKVGDSVREELLNLYQNGHTAGTALEMIKCNIQLTCDDYITALADRNKCPSYKYCYDLYMKEFKKKYGPMKFDTEAKVFLESKLTIYNNKQKDQCAKIILIGEENDYVIGICTPIMKRVHKYVEAASEIVFIDSSGTMDRDGSRIFVMLTHSECGALPLGLIITTSECVDAIKCGFNIIKELLGEFIFGGHEEGPAVFMTDDSQSEQKAIGETWPQSKRLLCIFHVLQAVFRWLSKSKNDIPRNQQSNIYKDFQNILYANSIDEATSKYNVAVENAKLFPKYINYLNNYWWPKRECWVKAYRRNVLIKNNHTNNYSESTIRQLKEKIFSRIKAFNLIQMMDFMLTKFEDFTQRKLLDATSNRSRRNLLDKDIKMPPLELVKYIKKLSDNIVGVPSQTKPNLIYLVNIEALICTCTVGTTGAICKHIDWANALFCTDKYLNKIDNIKVKEKLYFVATGQLSKGDWLLPLIPTCKTKLNTAIITQENKSSVSEDTISIPSTNNMAVPLLFDPDESKNKYTELLAKMTQSFDKFYEKSPLEVTNSMEKMISALDKIKTPASFSSAVATFGFGADGSRRRGRIIRVQKTSVGRRIIKKQKRKNNVNNNINNKCFIEKYINKI